MTRRYTGHPSPAEQIARRVGTNAGGYTLGVETPEGPRLFRGRPPSRREPPTEVREIDARDADVTYSPRAKALMDVLLKVGPVLPPLSEIARAIGVQDATHAVTRVTSAIATLERRGLISWTRPARGQHAIRIVATGAVLRSAGCPAEIVA